MTTVIDVSDFQGVPDFVAIKAAGAAAVICKATEGVTYTSPHYHAQILAARKAGLFTGSYHYGRPDHNSGKAEAEHFLDVTGAKLGPMDLKPALDAERGPTSIWSSAWIKDFNGAIHAHTGRWPFFYSYTSFVNALDLPAPVGNGLWLADFGRNDGTRHPVKPPKPWKRIQLHQFTSVGHVGPFRGDVSYAEDLNRLKANPTKGAA